MELRDYVSALRHRWFTVALCAILGLAAGVVYNSTAAKSYQADARSFVSVVSGSTTNDSNSIYAASQFALQRMKSYTELGDSNQVLEPVLNSLKLPGTVSDLASHVVVTNPAATVVLDISVTFSSPGDAAQIANAVAVSLGKVIQNLELTTPGSTSPVVVTVTKQAVPIYTPTTPRTKLDLALALVLGLCIGMALAIVRERLDRSLKTSEDVAAVVGSPALGLLGKRIDGSDQSRLSLDRRDLLIESEALRSLRTGLALANHGQLPRSFMICSVQSPLSPATVTGLAEVIGRASATVCVVEADLREPRIARFLDVQPAGGLGADLESNGASETDLYAVPSRGFTLIAAGDDGSVDPGLMLGSPRMKTIMEDLASLFDVVMVVAPPMSSADDARVIGRQTDGILLVCEYGKTTRADLEAATTSLLAADCHLLGVVLAGVPARAMRGVGRSSTGHPEPAEPSGKPSQPGSGPSPDAVGVPSSTPTLTTAESAESDAFAAAEASAAAQASDESDASVPSTADRTVRRGPRRPVNRPRPGLLSPQPVRSKNEDTPDAEADLGVTSAPDAR